MKRFHVHVSVPDLSEGIRFYSKLFGCEPSVREDDYAKWLVEEPRLNFAISQRSHPPGVNHLGFQVDSANELAGMRSQLASADHRLVEQSEAACCYAKSDKYWIADPAGVAWETFHTLDSIPIYGEDVEIEPKESACCVPKRPTAEGTCCEAAVAISNDSRCCAP